MQTCHFRPYFCFDFGFFVTVTLTPLVSRPTEGLGHTAVAEEGESEEGGKQASPPTGGTGVARDVLPWAYTSDDSISFPVDCILQGDLLVGDEVSCSVPCDVCWSLFWRGVVAECCLDSKERDCRTCSAC